MADHEPARRIPATTRSGFQRPAGRDEERDPARTNDQDRPIPLSATTSPRPVIDASERPSADDDTRHDSEPSEIARLRAELTLAQAELARRDHELEALRSDLRVTQTLAAKLRRSVSRSARAIDQSRFAVSLTRAALARVMAATSWPWRRGLFGRKAAQAELIRSSQLLDPQWYLEQNPDVAATRFDPLRHYLEFGASEGRDPHPLFDSDWYLSTYPEVALAHMNPLAHYVSVGAAHGFDPNPLFHTAWYLEQNPDSAKGGLNPLLHYMMHAMEKGRDPNPYFDSAWYWRQQELAETGENPLVHYLLHGAIEGYDPHPGFDTAWYLSRYPRVAQMRMNPLQHYLTIGALEGCRPAPLRREDIAERGQQANGSGARQASDLPVPSPEKRQRPRARAQIERSSIDVLRWRMRLDPASHPSSELLEPVGIFVHLFYDDLAEDVASLLPALPFDSRVYVSTDTSAKKQAIEASFKRYELEERTTVKILPNQGWDIAPFLLGFAEEIRAHDICLKLHAKKSQNSSRNYGLQWRNYLFSELVGDHRRAALAADCFLANPELGVLMARHWRGITRRADVNAIGSNFRPMRALLGRMGILIVRSQRIEFPSGSMFWFRSAALAPLLEAGLHWDDFADCYTSDSDATIAHAVERSILFSAAKAGYKWAFLPPRGRWAIRRLSSRLAGRRAPRTHH